MRASVYCGVLMVCGLLAPAGADACCLVNPFDTCGVCGPRPWLGFTCAIPLPYPCMPPPPCCGPVLPPPCCAPAPAILGPALPAIPAACDPCAIPLACETLQPQHVTTLRTVPTVEYRREAVVENVPVTTYQQITVPQTTYQPQLRYRDVAYSVNRQIAETRTDFVPQPRIGFSPAIPAAPCSTCDQVTPFAGAYSPPSISRTPIPSYGTNVAPAHPGVPSPIALPSSPSTASQPAATLATPQPYAETPWQTVPQRQAQDDQTVQQMGGFFPDAAPIRATSSRGMFQPAPSAAAVWQSRWMR